jgi:hypothetical protein
MNITLDKKIGAASFGALIACIALTGATTARAQGFTGGSTTCGTTTTSTCDGFENGPAARWQVLAGGDGVASFDTPPSSFANSGTDDGWLFVGNGWAAERISFDLSGVPGYYNCHASGYLQATGTGAQAGLEIWDPNGWVKVASNYPWIPGSGAPYQNVEVNFVRSQISGNTFYVQAMYGQTSGVKQFVRVDDVSWICGSI